MIIVRYIIMLLFLLHYNNSFAENELRSPPSGDISGGEKSCVDINSDKCKSWVVNIYTVDDENRESSVCTGSLITPNHVLTAGHCKIKGIKKYYVVSEYDKNKKITASDDNFTPMNISSPSGKNLHDLAILKLDNTLELDGKYGRIRRFFNYDEAYEKSNSNYYHASIYGYGDRGIDKTTGNQQSDSDNTQYRADVVIVSPAMDIYDSNGLAATANKDKEGLKPGIVQHGDSGGPVIWNDTIIGVSSGGFEVASLEQEDAYKRNYPFFAISDATGKHNNIGFIDMFSPGQWFSKNMEQIWIDTPDWNDHLRKRDGDVLIKGWGRPGSVIEIIYAINNNPQKTFKCENMTDNNGEWKCNIPNDVFYTDGVNKEEEQNVMITARELSGSLPKNNGWREDNVQAKISSISKEFGIVYPADKSTVFTKNFTIRGNADPESEVKLTLQSNMSDINYTQDQICKGLDDGDSMKTTNYGYWSCTINDNIKEIEKPNEGKEWNYIITASQRTKNLNVYDQVYLLYQPKENKKPNIKVDDVSLYRKMFPFNLELNESADFFCFFESVYLDCGKDPAGDKYVLNVTSNQVGTKLFDFDIFVKQKVPHIDPLDQVLWNKKTVKGRYFIPTFNDDYYNDISSPKEIDSSNQPDVLAKGYGGDDKDYTKPNGDILLKSEYSIYLKSEGEETFSPIKLAGGDVYSSRIVLTHDKNRPPTWEIERPYYQLKDGIYYIEVVDKYHPLGLKKFKENWKEPNRSYFRIITPEVKIETPSTGETSTVGTASYLSGSSNIPGDEVDVKRRKIDPSLSKPEENNQKLAQETSICTGAVVSDNGNWECGNPIIFPEGTYEITAELMKEGKVVAKDTTKLTIKGENDEPEKEKFDVKNPKDNSTVDPDNPIRLSGSLSGTGGASGFGGFLSNIFGSIFGGISSLFNSPFSTGLGSLWDLIIQPDAISGGDTYTITLQETHDKAHVGEPLTWHFTVPMRITSPAKGAQYKLHDGISIEGQGSPKQLIIVTGAKEFLPPKKMTLPRSNEGIICSATVDSKGKWTCPNQPVLSATSEGTFYIYAAQYKETTSTAFGGDYERTSQVTRKYVVAKTKIDITHPVHGAKITTLPFSIEGTGEEGAEVHINAFGNTKDCRTAIDKSGKWSCGPYQPEEGKYTVSAEQFIDGTQNSHSSVSFEVQTKTTRSVAITQPHNGGLYQYLENILPQGTGMPGTTVCLDSKELSQICQNGMTVDDQGNWEGINGLDTSTKGEQTLVATAFLNKVKQSTAKVAFYIGDDALTITSPKEGEVIKTPSYTLSGTIPENAKTVTVKAFGGHDECSAKLNKQNYTWTCGPYSSVSGDYNVIAVDDAGTHVKRSFKVRYGDNLQMRVLEPTEGEQIKTPTYTIAGKGQAGALIIIHRSGEPFCSVPVDENQHWACPVMESIPGSYKLLAQQWIDGAASGKPVIRNFDVIYMRDITINPTAEPDCAVANKTVSIPITGIAAKGADISLEATLEGKKTQKCGPVRVSMTDGTWSCTLENAQLGIYTVNAKQTITVNDHPYDNKKTDDVNAAVLSITKPHEGVYRKRNHLIGVGIEGTAQPNMEMSYHILHSENVLCRGFNSPKEMMTSEYAAKNSITADGNGQWNFNEDITQLGEYTLTIYAQYCGQPTSAQRRFCYLPYLR